MIIFNGFRNCNKCIIIYQLDTINYMNQLQFHSNSFQSLQTLRQIRDYLLVSLISQLNYNRLLLNSFHSQVETQAAHRLPSLAPEVKIQDTDQSYFKRMPWKIQKHRKTIKRFSGLNQRNLLVKNDTKNIPKNYGKAILTYILKSASTVKLTILMGINLPEFLALIKSMKNKINSIQGLRKMWGFDGLDSKYSKCIRVLSYQFMRKHCLRYIFYSKVRNFSTHVKYRQKLIQGIQKPGQFNHIKDY